MTAPEPEFAYVGFTACGCCVAATVDDPSNANRTKENAKIVAQWMREGLTIERKTIEWVRAGGLTFCQHKKAKPIAKDDLFAGSAAA